MLLQVNKERPLGHWGLGVLDYTAEDHHLILVFVVVEAAHVLERWNFVRGHLGDVESWGHGYLLPDEALHFRDRVVASTTMLKDFHKLMDIDSFEVVLHIPVIAVEGGGTRVLRQVLASWGSLITSDALKSLTPSSHVSKRIDISILHDTKSDTFSFIL